MNETTLKALWTRKLGGERVAALAREAGVTHQRLMAEWKRLGMSEQAGEKPADDAQPVAVPAAETRAAPAQEEPAPAPLTATPSAPAGEIDYHAIIKRQEAGEKWGALAKEVGCSWNDLWSRCDRVKKGQPALLVKKVAK